MDELRFRVPGIACRHCADAVSAAISQVGGIEDIQVEPETRWVSVYGEELDVGAIRAAADQAGHPAEL